MQEQSYYSHARPDVLALVPQDAQRIIDIGCGAGELGAALRERQGCEVIGIEPCEGAAHAARERLTRVWPLSAEEWLCDPDYEYDCIIAADVLEHLRDPEAVLRELHQVLIDAGSLVVSVPNARNWNVLARLLEGNVGYEDAGLMDRTHLRLFTRRELETTLWRAGYEVQELRPVLDPEHERWVAAGRPRKVGVPPFVYSAPSEADAEELFVYQWLARCRKRPAQPTLSIIIPVWNQLPYTQECLAALERTTDPQRTEIIVIDNGSDDGTGEWLRAWHDSPDNRHVITSETNRGFAWACNRGLEAAMGSIAILLNNDTLPGAGWIDALCAALGDPAVGAVGPVSNYVSGPQQVATPCTRRDQIEGFAWDWQRSNRGQTVEVPRLVGFCLALRREAVQQVGLLDERFGLGTYEDDDYCRRLAQAGWQLRIAPGSFVWHWGNRTFAGNGLDMMELQRENAAIYSEKWKTTS